jgi:hypothetical protein
MCVFMPARYILTICAYFVCRMHLEKIEKNTVCNLMCEAVPFILPIFINCDVLRVMNS